MNITNINIYAEGYYSGSSYEENIAIDTETYENLKSEIGSVNCYIYELDGKFSETKADLEIQNYTEDEIKNMEWDAKSDGDILFSNLKDIFEKHNLSLEDEIQKVNSYIGSLDIYKEITVRIHKSNVDKVKEFCKEL